MAIYIFFKSSYYREDETFFGPIFPVSFGGPTQNRAKAHLFTDERCDRKPGI